ncbi:MAG: hypothetical protein K6F69_00790 [Treponema sp.]|nr:hypothetical protein [Treponema sp.]
MNKIAVPVIILAFFCINCFAKGKDDVRFHERLIPDSRQYVMTVNSYDWGPAVDSVILNVGYPVVAFAIDKNEFTVDVIGAQATTKLGIVTGKLEVTEAYLSNEYGEKIDVDASDRTIKSPYVVLKFRISPEIEACKPFISFPASVLRGGVKDLRIKNDILDINITDSPYQ